MIKRDRTTNAKENSDEFIDDLDGDDVLSEKARFATWDLGLDLIAQPELGEEVILGMLAAVGTLAADYVAEFPIEYAMAKLRVLGEMFTRDASRRYDGLYAAQDSSSAPKGTEGAEA